MKSRMKVGQFLLPSLLVTLIYWLKYRCRISPRAEVDLSWLLTVGKGTEISAFCKIKAIHGKVVLGSHVSIGSGVFISAGEGGIVIGDACLISPGAAIVANNHGYDRLDVPMRKQNSTSKGIRIASNVWIGCGAVILDGAEIEEGVIVAPNSVVSGRVAKNSVVQGNPARVVFLRR